MKQYILLLCILFGMVLRGQSQSVEVLDKETSAPIPYVTIYSKKPQVSVMTDEKGKADISGFQGAKHITFQILGYENSVLSFEEIEESGFRIELMPAEFIHDEVIVSATRWRQSSGNVPARITTVGSEEIRLQNPQSAADLLGLSGKVFIQKSQQGGGSPMIRGFATNRLLYVIDGIRMNTAIFRGGNLQNVINLDPFATESAEVLFGPGSVIYGSDAIGGVMSFQTLTPKLGESGKSILAGNVIARYSSANSERTGHLDISAGWEKWGITTSISSWNYDHLRQGSKGPEDYVKSFYVTRKDSIDLIIEQENPLDQIPSAYSQINIMQKVRFKPNDHWDLNYGFHYSETSDYGRYDRHNRMQNGVPQYGEWKYGPQKWLMNMFSATHSSNSKLFDEMTLRIAHQFFEESRISRNFNEPDREFRMENVTAWSVNLDLARSLGKSHTLHYGTEYILNDVSSSGIQTNIISNNNFPASTRYPQAKWQSVALYLNDTYQVTRSLTIQGGFRYNQFLLDADFSKNLAFFPLPFDEASLNNGSLTGSIGAVVRPTSSWVFRLNAGTAFRSPNVDDIGKVFDSEPGAVVVPNPDLDAEYAYNFDLGVARILGEVVKLDLTAYYTKLENAMVRRDFSLNGQDTINYDGIPSRVQAIQNAASANVWGIQAGIEVKLPGGFRFTSDLNYQEGEEEGDDGTTSPSRHAAPLFGVSRISFEKNAIELQMNIQYQGQRSHDNLSISERGKTEIYALDNDGNTYSPAWYTLNFKGLYKINEAITLTAGIENITDQRYRPYSSGISGPGRSIITSLTASF